MKKLAASLVVLFGLSFGIVSLAADFNGDGEGDIAIFRASSGLWSVRGITRIYFGSTGDAVVPGDYDGSGTDSPAIFRAASGLWAVRGVTRVYFGGSSDEAKPGDYNGDGVYDFGIFRGSTELWAVKGITRLYYGSSTDVAISPGKTRGGLPPTGQTTEYRPGDDGTHQAGAPFRYESLYFFPWDGVTVDHKTGLMWAHDANWSGCNWGQQTNWNAAIDWCNNMVFAGYDDWRLSNIKELQSIVDYGTYSPAIDTTYFFNIKLDYYWSSTTYDGGTSQAWVVNFESGGGVVVFKSHYCYVRAFRGGE